MRRRTFSRVRSPLASITACIPRLRRRRTAAVLGTAVAVGERDAGLLLILRGAELAVGDGEDTAAFAR